LRGEGSGEAGAGFFRWRGEFDDFWIGRNAALSSAEVIASEQLKKLDKYESEIFETDKDVLGKIDFVVYRLSDGDPTRMKLIREMKAWDVASYDYQKRVENLNKTRDLIAYKKHLDELK
jgi:hypothetical protein